MGTLRNCIENMRSMIYIEQCSHSYFKVPPHPGFLILQVFLSIAFSYDVVRTHKLRRLHARMMVFSIPMKKTDNKEMFNLCLEITKLIITLVSNDRFKSRSLRNVVARRQTQVVSQFEEVRCHVKLLLFDIITSNSP